MLSRGVVLLQGTIRIETQKYGSALRWVGWRGWFIASKLTESKDGRRPLRPAKSLGRLFEVRSMSDEGYAGYGMYAFSGTSVTKAACGSGHDGVATMGVDAVEPAYEMES